jgi:hypothetical protein
LVMHTGCHNSLGCGQVCPAAARSRRKRRESGLRSLSWYAYC